MTAIVLLLLACYWARLVLSSKLTRNDFAGLGRTKLAIVHIGRTVEMQ